MGVLMFDIATGLKNLFEGIRHQSRMTHSGVVITSTAILDNQLEHVLKTAMRPLSKKMYERLFDSFGPLSSFASKIVMAYALGIITSEIYDELEKIRHIRNEFSHSSKLLNFESKEIAPKFLALKKPQTTERNPSDNFVKCVVVIFEFLDAYLVRMGEPQKKEKGPA
jgi:DNA-binding MltR family transcriptional regulator